MLDDTPRTFVGRANFVIAGMRCRHCERAVTEELLTTPGVTQAIADAITGTVCVTVDRPVDRTDIAAAVARAGHRIASL